MEKDIDVLGDILDDMASLLSSGPYGYVTLGMAAISMSFAGLAKAKASGKEAESQAVIDCLHTLISQVANGKLTGYDAKTMIPHSVSTDTSKLYDGWHSTVLDHHFLLRIDDLFDWADSNNAYAIGDAFREDFGVGCAFKTPEGNDTFSNQMDRVGVSNKLAILNQATKKWWANADPDDRTTYPSQSDVVAWLIDHGFSKITAISGATIIRPEWAPAGRKPKE